MKNHNSEIVLRIAASTRQPGSLTRWGSMNLNRESTKSQAWHRSLAQIAPMGTDRSWMKTSLNLRGINMKILKRVCLTFAVALLLVGVISAQKTWEKPYKKWSKDDAMKIVTTSPWAATYQSINGSAAASQSQIARNQTDTVNGGGNGRNAGSFDRNAGPAPVVFRLHSGRPIREAIQRGREIAAGYDKMDDQKKQEFDASGKGFLDCAICKDYYVVSATKFPDPTSGSVDEGILQGSTLNDLKGNVWLVNDKGEKREIFQFTPPKRAGDSAYMFFARKDENGSELIRADTKSFKLLFNNNFFLSSNPYAALMPSSMEFKVPQLLVGNKLEF